MSYGFDMILYRFEKCFKNIVGNFGSFGMIFDIFHPGILIFTIHIRKVNSALRRNSGSPFWGPKLEMFIFIFPNVRPAFRQFGLNRTFGLKLERSDRNSNVRPESWIFRPEYRTGPPKNRGGTGTEPERDQNGTAEHPPSRKPRIPVQSEFPVERSNLRSNVQTPEKR